MPAIQTTAAQPARFATTQWTLVVAAAADESSPQARDALTELCRAYWLPLYAFARRRGKDGHTAKDLVQGFFLSLIGNRTFENASRERGRFRSFLIGGLKNYEATEWERAHRQKRGGHETILSFDDERAEDSCATLHEAELSPEKAYERQWAVTVIEHALEGLRAQFAERGKQPLFDALAPFLTGEEIADGYAELGRRFSLSTSALKSMVLRLRQAFRAELRREIGRTVASPLEIDDEFRHLQAALR